MTTVITAPPPVRTSDMKCSADGARPLATRSVRPMGVTRIAQLTRPDGSARLPGGANMVRSTPWLRYQLSSIRDRTVMAEDSSPAKQSRKSRSSASAAARIRPDPDDPPLRALRGGERRHARIRPLARPGRGIQTTQLITRPPQLDLGQQPQVGLGPLVAHPPSLHLAPEHPATARGPPDVSLGRLTCHQRR